MVSKYQFDIAFSVAKEDLVIAQQIAHALKIRGIRYYLYTEHSAENLGKTLMQISQEVYGQRARHVLILTSKVFVENYWTEIESQIVHVAAQKKADFIFRLKVDETPVDSISKHLFCLVWKNNHEEIADIIKEKIKSKARIKRLWQKLLTLLICLFSALVIYNATKDYSIPQLKKNNPNASNVDSVSKVNGEKGRSLGKSNVGISKTEKPLDAVLNELKMGKVKIEATTFYMGSNNTRPQDSPAHTVSIKSFYISKTEISIREYTIFAEATNRFMPVQSTHLQNNDYPVVNITWEDANAFCEWVGGRLPKEAEWEYAAGGGQSSKYSGGNNASVVAIYGKTNSCKIASRAPNMFGIYDMSGNVSEWCADWYAPYNSSLQTNPLITDSSSGRKVVRGGHYASHVKPDPEGNQLRITCRDSDTPNARKPYIGFRVAWDN